MRVLSVSLDSWRYDTIPEWFTKQWARSLKFYKNMHTFFHSTMPSLTSMYTGLPPQWHGILDQMQFHKYPFRGISILQELKKQGVNVFYSCDERMIRQAPFAAGIDKITFRSLKEKLEIDNTLVAVHMFNNTHIPYASKEVTRIMNEQRQHSWLDKDFCKMARQAQWVQINKLLRWITELIGTTGCDAIVTADHGDAHGEYGLFGHGEILHESVLHIPYMVINPDEGSSEVSNLTYNTDTFHILANWFGCKTKPGISGEKFYQGRDQMLWHGRRSLADQEFPGGVPEGGASVVEDYRFI